jgi:hypothetical protein
MKPTLPEERDLEKMSSEVSERYRAGRQEEPPQRLDAAIQAAARREVQPPRQQPGWRMPASIAAMLVIGVSLVLIVRDNEPALPSLQSPSADEAKLAKSAPPHLTMNSPPKAKADFRREDRPSRERSVRPDREPAARDEMASTQDKSAGAGAAGQPAAAPATPPVALPAKPVEQEQGRIAESSELLAQKKATTQADVASESRASAQALRKQEIAAPTQRREWLEEIDRLLREGKDTEARRRLLEFHQQYPDYPLAQRLEALLPPDAAK